MIYRKDITSARTLIVALSYCDERRIVQIRYKDGAIEQFHGVPFDLFYGLASGPSADLSVRRSLWGRFLYVLTHDAEVFKTRKDIELERVHTCLAERTASHQKLFQEAVAARPSKSPSVSTAKKPGSASEQLARAVEKAQKNMPSTTVKIAGECLTPGQPLPQSQPMDDPTFPDKS